ncbi:MAG: McrC family protein [Bacteroidetes bacterium]|nr:McrC family protein [Bacteroidota bacterium]
MIHQSKPIQVFEHELLRINEEIGFTQRHWKSLGWYNEKHGGDFFTLTPNGVKFKEYVGVLQVDNLTIEVLPKISRQAPKGEEAKWQKVLIDMLRECEWMRVHSHDKASLRFKPHSILEAYLEIFLNECELIHRAGLLKQYRAVERNTTALKGQLQFQKNIQQNVVHKERFYTRFQVYDTEHLLNQLLVKALKVIPQISSSPALKDRVYSLLLNYPDLPDIAVNQQTFDKIVFSRKTNRYKSAIEIAAMLLLNFRPDVSSGQNHVLAILFNMNDLWEEYLFRQIRKHRLETWKVQPQRKKVFWQLTGSRSKKRVIPDIVVHCTDRRKTIIIDTKWKLPQKNLPSDADLKQMFVYNELWKSECAILLYPQEAFVTEPSYDPGNYFKDKVKIHACGLMKTSILRKEGDSLDREAGKKVVKFVEERIFA